MTDSPDPTLPLAGLTCVCMAANVPGPAAAALLAAQGMAVIKIEPPAGDMTATIMPGWYAELNTAARVETVDLRAEAGQARFRDLLTGADVLISSHRPAALARLGITVEALAAVNSGLCWVEIVGDTGAPEVPGHDLTYQVESGLIDPERPAMPRTLLADVLGSREAYAAALALLLGRERGRTERERLVGLGDAAHFAAAPLRSGLTAPGGLLSGTHDIYGLYPSADGWVAAAPLEPHFADRWRALLGPEGPAALRRQSTAHWIRVAQEQDLPLAAVKP